MKSSDRLWISFLLKLFSEKSLSLAGRNVCCLSPRLHLAVDRSCHKEPTIAPPAAVASRQCFPRALRRESSTDVRYRRSSRSDYKQVKDVSPKNVVIRSSSMEIGLR